MIMSYSFICIISVGFFLLIPLMLFMGSFGLRRDLKMIVDLEKDKRSISLLRIFLIRDWAGLILGAVSIYSAIKGNVPLSLLLVINYCIVLLVLRFWTIKIFGIEGLIPR